MESSRTRYQTHVPCIGRQILIYCTTREAPKHSEKAEFESQSHLSNFNSIIAYCAASCQSPLRLSILICEKYQPGKISVNIHEIVHVNIYYRI